MVVLATAVAACGSDDERAEIAEEGTGNPYTQAIIESTSHDEILHPGGDMVVAVNCNADTELPLVTVVANGLAAGAYVGVFEPSTGVEIEFETAAGERVVVTEEMALEDDTYVVTFDAIEGGTFDLTGC